MRWTAWGRYQRSWQTSTALMTVSQTSTWPSISDVNGIINEAEISVARGKQSRKLPAAHLLHEAPAGSRLRLKKFKFEQYPRTDLDNLTGTATGIASEGYPVIIIGEFPAGRRNSRTARMASPSTLAASTADITTTTSEVLRVCMSTFWSNTTESAEEWVTTTQGPQEPEQTVARSEWVWPQKMENGASWLKTVLLSSERKPTTDGKREEFTYRYLFIIVSNESINGIFISKEVECDLRTRIVFKFSWKIVLN